jgi:voltage-gated sodium channel
MNNLTRLCRKLTGNKIFEFSVVGLIVLNTVFIGIDPHERIALLHTLQRVILGMFTVEIAIRFLARESLKSYVKDGWNLFDIALVSVGYLPETMFLGSQQLILFRTLRTVRVLRLLRVSSELRVISGAFVRSFRSLFHTALFFFTFMYLFAILGTVLFKLPEREALTPAQQEQYDIFTKEDPNAYAGMDAFGSVSESMFTLFRISTGDDWTVVRYSILKASKLGLVDARSILITGYLVVWFALSVFLLLNLLLGAVVNNYQAVMEEYKNKQLAE